MPAPTISALTPAPNRLDPNFATVADAFLNGFPTLRAEINAFANYLNTTALVSYAFSDGTASQPSLRFASDSNTGLFRPTSDTLAFSTTASERLRITADGKVGIGTSNPLSKMHVSSFLGFSPSTSTLLVENTAVGNPVALAFKAVADNAGAGNQGAIYFEPGASGTVGDNQLQFNADHQDGTTPQMVIGANGRVGIGTKTPNKEMEIRPLGATGATLRITGGILSAQPEDLVGAVEFFSSDADGQHVSSFVKGVARDTFGRTGALTFGVSKTISTDATEAMRISEFGRVGIGVTVPSSLLELAESLGPTITLTRTNSPDGNGRIRSVGSTGVVNAEIVLGGGSNDYLKFDTGGVERMRVDASGNVLVGTTVGPVNTSGATGVLLAANGQVQIGRSGNQCLTLNRSGTDGAIAAFQKGGVTVGTISVAGSTTSYNTSSDYRLKEDLQDILSPAERLMRLSPVNVSWKADGSRSDAFIAHELAGVLPYAVTGEKDAVDSDGNPEYQSVDYSKVVPLLTAALQEALNKIEELETRINAMESQA